MAVDITKVYSQYNGASTYTTGQLYLDTSLPGTDMYTEPKRGSAGTPTQWLILGITLRYDTSAGTVIVDYKLQAVSDQSDPGGTTVRHDLKDVTLKINGTTVYGPTNRGYDSYRMAWQTDQSSAHNYLAQGSTAAISFVSNPSISIEVSAGLGSTSATYKSSLSTSIPVLELIGAVRVKQSGQWKVAIPYAKVSGQWKMALPYAKNGGSWKLAT